MQKRFSFQFILIISFLLFFNIVSPQEKINNQPTVYFFLATSCPISQQYTKEIIRLQDLYGRDGVKFKLVFPNDGKKSIKKDIVEFNTTYGLTCQYINDKKFILTKKYNATVTPETFLIAANGDVIYHGAIDNWYYQLGKNRINITAHYLEDAISEALQGKAVRNSYAEPIGCFIEVPQKIR